MQMRHRVFEIGHVLGKSCPRQLLPAWAAAMTAQTERICPQYPRFAKYGRKCSSHTHAPQKAPCTNSNAGRCRSRAGRRQINSSSMS